MTGEKIRANVYVATPGYGSVVATDYVLGLLDLHETSARYEFGLQVHFNSFDSLVTRARNTMAAEFLADSCFTHLMWIDGDIGFKGADVMRLLKADRPVVAGVYPLKSDGWPRSGLSEPLAAGTTKADFQARFATYPAVARTDNLEPDADGFLEVLYAPTGFMLIKREVFRALIQRFPELHCRTRMQGRDDEGAGVAASLHYSFFDTMIDPQTRVYLSKDYAFCRRIESIGIAPAVDTQSDLSHQGVAVFQGDLSRSLKLQRSARSLEAR